VTLLVGPPEVGGGGGGGGGGDGGGGGGGGGAQFTGTALLLSKASEDPGYGLYSYILLPHAPAPYEKERYRSLLIALLNIPTVKDLSALVPKSQINTTYLLTKEMPPLESPFSAADEADFLLQNYDYARATVLLSTLPKYTGLGPIIVSVLHPLQYGQTPNPVLVQNLSDAQPDLMSVYVDAFSKRVAQGEVWQPQSLASLSLSLRNLLETTAVGLGLSRTAVTSWIKLSE